MPPRHTGRKRIALFPFSPLSPPFIRFSLSLIRFLAIYPLSLSLIRFPTAYPLSLSLIRFSLSLIRFSLSLIRFLTVYPLSLSLVRFSLSLIRFPTAYPLPYRLSASLPLIRFLASPLCPTGMALHFSSALFRAVKNGFSSRKSSDFQRKKSRLFFRRTARAGLRYPTVPFNGC